MLKKHALPSLATFIVLTLGSPAGAVTSPRIRVQPRANAVAELGPDASAAVLKFDSQFQMFAAEDFIPSVRELFADLPGQTPMAIVGDFNGDRRPDVVVSGHSHGERLTLAVLSNPNGFAVSVVERQAMVAPRDSLFPPIVEDNTVSDESESLIGREKGLFEYLTLLERRDRAPRDGTKHFKNDAVAIETYRGNTRLFRVVDQTFREWTH